MANVVVNCNLPQGLKVNISGLVTPLTAQINNLQGSDGIFFPFGTTTIDGTLWNFIKQQHPDLANPPAGSAGILVGP